MAEPYGRKCPRCKHLNQKITLRYLNGALRAMCDDCWKEADALPTGKGLPSGHTLLVAGKGRLVEKQVLRRLK